MEMLTRRAALSGAVAMVAAVAAPPASCTVSRVLPGGITPGLAALIAANAAAEKAQKEYEANVSAPLAAAAKARMDALPHATATIHDRLYSTAVREDVRLSRAIVAGGRGLLNAREHYRDHRAFTAAALRRQRAADRIWRQSGAGAADDMSDRLSEAWADTEGEVAAYPVSTAADLHAKLAFMVACHMDGETGWLPYLAADAARVAKLEGRA